jgi:hypothetical protein
MAIEDSPMRNKASVGLCLGILLGLALGIPTGILATRLWPGDPAGVVVQKGVVSEAAGMGEYNVFYPRPFVAPPNLIISNKRRTGHAVKFVDQRADGFRISFIAWNSGASEPPGYEATGVLAKLGE